MQTSDVMRQAITKIIVMEIIDIASCGNHVIPQYAHVVRSSRSNCQQTESLKLLHHFQNTRFLSSTFCFVPMCFDLVVFWPLVSAVGFISLPTPPNQFWDLFVNYGSKTLLRLAWLFLKAKRVVYLHDARTEIVGRNHTARNTQCALCLSSIRRGDRVTRLNCIRPHYFHANCVAPVLKTTGACPACRRVLPSFRDARKVLSFFLNHWRQNRCFRICCPTRKVMPFGYQWSCRFVVPTSSGTRIRRICRNQEFI